MRHSQPDIDELFYEALEVPAGAARDRWLEQQCLASPEVKQRLCRLLRAAERTGGFLEQAPTPPICFENTQPTWCSPSWSLRSRIGPYRLIKRIGEGGMGVVYLAEQSEPIERQVAIKLIRSHLDDFAIGEKSRTSSIVARFEVERQTLARMEHPNIAKVLDAGTIVEPESVESWNPTRAKRDQQSTVVDTPAGENHYPYFVMELVRGVLITEYCDSNRLTVQQRLQLFVPVCQAIQHAHQKGIIHRDLKPSNVLVTNYDGTPVPKIIDFGVAKAIDRQVTDITLTTGIGAVVGTVEYMSPEQASLDQLDVDTRTDIYSLGAIFFELLTGRPPFGHREREEPNILKMLHIVREQEPQRPSSSVSDSLACVRVAQCRGTTPSQLAALLHGELDWIVLKTLEKDRERRYASAHELARDIQRYLAGEPVQAVPPSRWYRFSKFIRRYRWQTLATTIAFVASMVAMLGVGLGWRRAVRAEQTMKELYIMADRARAEAVRREEGERKALLIAKEEAQSRKLALAAESRQRKFAESVSHFVQNDVLALTTDEGQLRYNGQDLPRNASLRTVLLRAADKLKGRSDLDPAASAELHWIVGVSLRAMGETAKAVEHLSRSTELHLQTFGELDPRTLNAINSLAMAYLTAGKPGKTIELLSPMLDETPGRPQPYPQLLPIARQTMAAALIDTGRPSEAMSLLEQNLTEIRELHGNQLDDTVETKRQLAKALRSQGEHQLSLSVLNELYGMIDSNPELSVDLTDGIKVDYATALVTAGQLDQARDLLQVVVPAIQQRLGADHPTAIQASIAWADWLLAARQASDTIEEYSRLIALSREVLGPRHPSTLSSQNNLALLYHRSNRFPDALELFTQTAKAAEQSVGPDDLITLRVKNNLGLLLTDMGRVAEAEQLLSEVVERWRVIFGADHPDTLNSMNNHATCLAQSGKSRQARELLDFVVPTSQRVLGVAHPETITSSINLAKLMKDQGETLRSIELYQSILALTPEQLPESAELRLKAKNNLAVVWWKRGELDKSLPMFEELVEAHRGRDESLPPTIAYLNALANLAINYNDAGMRQKAISRLEYVHRMSHGVPSFPWVTVELRKMCVLEGRVDIVQQLLFEDLSRLPPPGLAMTEAEQQVISDWALDLAIAGDWLLADALTMQSMQEDNR